MTFYAEAPDEALAAHFGDPYAEQKALVAGSAVVARSNRGVVRVSGPDRLSWLHSLLSQHLTDLRPGEATEALLLSPNGHIEHHLSLVDDGEAVWAHVEPGTAAQLAAFLDRMKFLLRVEVADVSAEYEVVTGTGLEGALSLPDVEGMTSLIVPRGTVFEGRSQAGIWAYEALRIASHKARFGLDTDHRTIPHEIGFIDVAVHLNKGCYRGQETVARVHNLGRPPRRLVFLHLDGSADRLPAHGCDVELDGRRVGFVGSSARHYELGPIGLALVKRNVPVEAVLSADGVAAGQEIVVSPDTGANVTIDPALRGRRL
ncbi:glycine cleavage T C-terminal barrel domain-containing protein [Actinocorallia sp. B10E7]|uniref:CAF17-like 4Fe-4S cluster assembly/insertion protein YgfZ n=1 Tax=Actinocorallia sp. B10E7 TaxID=3153558 RepID=UPI00325CA4A9